MGPFIIIPIMGIVASAVGIAFINAACHTVASVV